MKEKIIHIASDLFLTFGFKSVTMDDIAEKLGISKKTIYLHFETKNKLVEATVLYMFKKISAGIERICIANENPIEELFEIKKFVHYHLKGEKSSPHFQLQKYYPKIFMNIKQQQISQMKSCILQNMEKGIQQGLYRKELDLEFISLIYYNTATAIKDKNLYPLKNYTPQKMMLYFLEYHLRGICTLKGIEKLEELLININHEK